MASVRRMVAVDLGASSGRAILGTLGDTLRLESVHRFPNGPVSVEGILRWDFERLWDGVREGIRRAGTLSDGPIESVGVDTWGVDYGLIGKDGELLEAPIHYRDDRTDGAMDAVFQRVPRREVFEATGIQFIQLNTLYQLFAHARTDRSALDRARYLL
ncbi:MAG TPA: rhamnulokinase, partial [Firmicutes bacterium]|nr:rhamnulokinase [Bacillota bacterium]